MQNRKSLPLLALGLALLVAPLAFGDDDKDLYLDQEKVEVKEPALKVTRPSRDWQFLSIEALNKKYPGQKDEKLKARLYQGGANANFYVLSWTDERAELTTEKVGDEQQESCRSCFKEKGKLGWKGHTKVGKYSAWTFEVEGALASNGDELFVSKSVIYRAADKMVFVLSLELPKKNVKLVEKDKSKLFSGVEIK